MEDKRINLLKEAPIKKAVNAMALPAIISMIVVAVYNVVDTMFVSWLGTQATGATQVVLPIVMLISAVGLCFGIGGGSFLSRLLGNKDYEKANKVTSTAFFTVVGGGIIFTILSILFLEPILKVFGASGTIMGFAKDYGFYILVGSLFQMGNMALNNLLRSEGSGKISMMGMAIGAVVNIVIDPIFIFTLDLGISGAAIATTLSQIITFSILLGQFLKHKTVSKIHIKYFTPSSEIYKEIFKVGIPTFLQQFLFGISIGFLNQAAVTAGGDNLLAAVGIMYKIIMIPTCILFGIGQGFQPVTGYNFGAKNRERVIESLKYSMLVSLIFGLVSAIILFAFGSELMSIFKPEKAVVEYGITGLKINALSMILMSFSNIIAIYYQAIGKGKEALFLSITRQGIFFIPVIFVLPNLIGLNGVFLAQPVADLLTMIITMIIFVPFVKNDRLTAEMGL